jgi:hypothetical protein
VIAMPQFDVALVSFSKLVSLLGPDGVVQWGWFLDPVKGSFASMPPNRQHLGEFLRACSTATSTRRMNSSPRD